ncbi:MAG TPA: imidazole glycerol phosphate synthase subunit HisF [Candidatus Saccharimonadales bacterium]|nr:imidazole glycerol phosphate synthase subunit HisF [Candidatus Saccharimonadales bacterium]
MLAKRIIPCMDIKDDRVVKGTHFKNLIDSGDPLELAEQYAGQGADELVLLDVAATVEERKHRVELVKAVAEKISIPFSVGGGVSKPEHVRELLNAGADKVSIGSAAVNDMDFVRRACDEFGSQAIIVSIDPMKNGDKWEVYIKGGRENTHIDAIEFAHAMQEAGVGELLVNSLDRDGTKKGFDIELLKNISEEVDIPVIASSGAGSLEDFVEVFKNTEVTAALGASVFHKGEFTVGQVKTKLRENGLEVRL